MVFGAAGSVSAGTVSVIPDSGELAEVSSLFVLHFALHEVKIRAKESNKMVNFMIETSISGEKTP
jgi:hypothetical protein